MPDLDIVIPVWRCIDYAVACLDSVRKNTDVQYRVIVIDNGNTEADFERLLVALPNEASFILSNEENMGFVKATNQGMKAADAPYVCLLNSDTEVPRRWASRLLDGLQGAKGAGMIGPRSTCEGQWQGREPKRNEVVEVKRGPLAFFCTIIRQDCIADVGYLDEAFGIGFGDDDDYCNRARKKKWRLYIHRGVTVVHHHRTTFKAHVPEWEKLQQRNIELLKRRNK